MNRIIKFRGKDRETGEWLHGSLVPNGKNKAYIAPFGMDNIAHAFAEETSNGDALDPYIDFATEFASEVLEWLSKDYIIVPKIDVLNQHAFYMQRMKEVSSNRQMNRGKAIALENLFGKKLFEN